MACTMWIIKRIHIKFWSMVNRGQNSGIFGDVNIVMHNELTFEVQVTSSAVQSL